MKDEEKQKQSHDRESKEVTQRTSREDQRASEENSNVIKSLRKKAGGQQNRGEGHGCVRVVPFVLLMNDDHQGDEAESLCVAEIDSH